MLTAQQLRDKLHQDSSAELPQSNTELLKLYSLKPEIEATVSAMLLDTAKPNLKGVTFYDNILGEKFAEFKKSLSALPLDVVADHICNWFYLNEYFAKFVIEDNQTIHFLIKWSKEPN